VNFFNSVAHCEHLRGVWGVVIFDSMEGGKTDLTLQRNHSITIANRHGEDRGSNQSLDKLAKVLGDRRNQI
jgi:hypothetical protein